MENKYHSLHCHSNMSIRDSVAKIEDIAKRNKELGIDSLCITDHANLACMIEAIEIAKKYQLQLILGIELYIVDETDEFYNRKGEQRNHILLLAKNYKGLQNIFKITSLSNKTKFNGYPRLTYQQFFELDFENIYVSGACSIGFLQRYNFEEYAVKLLDKFKDDLYLEIIPVSYINQKDTDKYNKLIEQKELTQQEQDFIDSIKPEYWIEQDGVKGIDGGKVANLRALYLHQKYQIPVIISVDSHYVLKEDADTHEVLTAINSRKKMLDPKRWRFGSGELYIHSYNELLEKTINLKYIPINVIEKGLSYTNTIANNINLEFPNYYINLPTPFPNENDEDVLKRYIKKGLEKYKIHEKPNVQEYYDRINYEFNTLKEYKLSRYLLIIIDVYDFMEKNDIPKGSGRGCYTEDAQVWTTDGYKKISEVKIGDNVINEDGVIDVVNDKFQFDIQENLYKIDYLFGSNTFCPKICTGDHKQLVHKNNIIEWKQTKDLDNSYDLCIPKLKPLNKVIPTIDLNDYNDFGYEYDDEYIYEKVRTNKTYKFSVHELWKQHGISQNCTREFMRIGGKSKISTITKIQNITDMNQLEYINYIKNNSYIIKKTKRFLNIDENFNKIIGIMMGDGWCSTKNGSGYIGIANNTQTKKNVDNRAEFKIFYDKFFDTDDFYSENKSKTKNLSQLYIYSKLLANFFEKEIVLYDDNKFKYFNRKWLEQDEKNIKAIFDGLMMTDGHYGKRQTFDNTSIKLISSMIELILRLNKIPSIAKRGQTISDGYICKESYKIEIREYFTNTGNNQFIQNSYNLRKGNDKYFFVPINNITNLGIQNTTVYDLSIKNKQSFMINNYITHNSIGGCMIAYLCGLCDLDPLEYGLIFERFFNAGKVKKSYNEKGELILTADNMADIDFDVSHARRIEIINFLMERYGNKNVSQLSNYNYFTPKSAFKAVTSAFEIPFSEANKLSDYIEDGTYNENNKVIMYDAIDSFKYVKELQEFCNQNPHIYKHIVKLNKTLNATGKHASAILICSHALDDIATLDYDNGYEVCSLNMYGATKLSILKLDCLSINTADIIHNACKMIGIKQEDIPLKDAKTEALIASGMSSGIMQFESGLAKSTLKKIGRGDFKILVALNALLRPSALQSKDETGMTTYEKFIKTANGEIPLEYITPELEPILKDSYGCIVFQEDIMNIANKLGNFNLSESAVIMKAISKKKNDVIESYKPKFIEGCKSHNIDENKAITIFNIMIMAAKYCFNLSHSALYSCNSFRCGYLKANYPKQFWASTLSYASKADLIPNYIQEIKASDIQIKTPDINLSHATKYIIIDDYILAPLNSCKWVGDNISKSIISIRTTPFLDMNDFNNRINQLPKRPNKRCLASLFYSNAFKSLNHYEKDPKKASEKMLEYLPIFSPLPYIDLTQNIERDFTQIKSIANTIKQCAKEEYIKPIGTPNNALCILEVGKQETQLMEVHSWFKSELEKRLNYQICVISPSGCKDLCQNKCIDKLELFIQSIKPLLILNCSSKTSKIFGYKFGETFGNINYVEKFDCHLINIPSPAYMGFKKDVKEIYRNKIIPLLENYKVKTEIA